MTAPDPVELPPAEEPIPEASWDRALESAFTTCGGASDARVDLDLRGRSGLGRFELGEEIARGGVGSVWRARDLDLGRVVAVKRLHVELATDGELVRRFVEEAQIAGQLQHPGVVPIYDFGVDPDGRPWFAMKLVEGETLSALLAKRSDVEDQRGRWLRVFATVCDTVAYAHARSVVHRDLKPHNVMVGAFGEVQVMDWGFAKVVGEAAGSPGRAVETVRTGVDAAVSLAGSMFGTPAYMAPEQAAGDHEAVDARTDVFALGAMLCEILTGAPPYGGDAALESARTAQLDDARTRLSGCGAEASVVQLALRCLAADPAARPPSAAEVGAAVHDTLERAEQNVREARIAAAAAEARAGAERRARRVTVLLVGIVLLALTAGVAGWWIRTAERDDLRRAVVDGMRQATALAAGDPDGALAVLERAEGLAGADASAFGLEQALRDTRAHVTAHRRRAHFAEQVLRLRSDPDPSPKVVHAYQRLFEEHGIAVLGNAPATVAASVAGDALGAAVPRALEDWARRAREHRRGGDVAPHLLTVASAIDADPTRADIRTAWAAHDADRLGRLTDRLLAGEAAKVPAETALLLAQAWIGERAAARASEVLAFALDEHDADLWLHWVYAQACLMIDPPQRELATQHLELAKVLHPDRRWRPLLGPEARGLRPGGRPRAPGFGRSRR